MKPDWIKIKDVARAARDKIDRCNKPGSRMRFAYIDSLRTARGHGYTGTDRQWETFVRRVD